MISQRPFFQFSIPAKNITRSAVDEIIDSSVYRKEKDDARTAIDFNLPFAVGSCLIIPTGSIEVNNRLKTLIFGGQILSDDVGE